MARRKSYFASILLVVLTLGVVSPFSHFVFMAATGAYTMEMGMDGNHSQASHEVGGHEVVAQVLPSDAPSGFVAEADIAHETCPYAALFGHIADGFASDSAEASFSLPNECPFVLASDSPVNRLDWHSGGIRGPPQA